MKSFCVLLCVVLVALQEARCDSHDEKEIAAMKKCSAENKIKSDDLQAFVDGKESSKDVKCFMKCMMMDFGALKEDGTITVVEHDGEGDGMIAAIAAECLDVEKSDDLCEVAYLHAVCVREKDTDGKVGKAMMKHADEI